MRVVAEFPPPSDRGPGCPLRVGRRSPGRERRARPLRRRVRKQLGNDAGTPGAQRPPNLLGPGCPRARVTLPVAAPSPAGPALPRSFAKLSLASGATAGLGGLRPSTRWGRAGLHTHAGGLRAPSRTLGGGPVGEAGVGRAALHVLTPGSGRAPQVSPHLLPRYQSCGAAVTASPALVRAGSAGGPRGSAANTPRGRPGRGGRGARGGATLGAWPRGLTINESEGPQEHDPCQPESAHAEAGWAALEVALLPRRSLGLRVPSPGLASPQ